MYNGFMTAVLFLVIFVQFVLIVYFDYQNRTEREKILMMSMSEGLKDYVATVEGEDESAVQEEDPYLEMDEVSVEQLLKAKEK